MFMYLDFYYCIGVFVCSFDLLLSISCSVVAQMAQRRAVIQLYKELHFMGRDYPAGAAFFHQRLHNAFMKNSGETDPDKIDTLIARGRYVQKEIEALYALRRYRAMKQRYYDQEEMERHQRNIERYIRELDSE
eukprot:sb/3474883/